MLFNSLPFLCFFPTVCVVYWLLQGKTRAQNIFLLAASYYFYMNWEPAYALLIAVSTCTTWYCARMLDRGNRGGKRGGGCGSRYASQ